MIQINVKEKLFTIFEVKRLRISEILIKILIDNGINQIIVAGKYEKHYFYNLDIREVELIYQIT